MSTKRPDGKSFRIMSLLADNVDVIESESSSEIDTDMPDITDVLVKSGLTLTQGKFSFSYVLSFIYFRSVLPTYSC